MIQTGEWGSFYNLPTPLSFTVSFLRTNLIPHALYLVLDCMDSYVISVEEDALWTLFTIHHPLDVGPSISGYSTPAIPRVPSRRSPDTTPKQSSGRWGHCHCTVAFAGCTSPQSTNPSVFPIYRVPMKYIKPHIAGNGHQARPVNHFSHLPPLYIVNIANYPISLIE